jgi:hypothetical protein
MQNEHSRGRVAGERPHAFREKIELDIRSKPFSMGRKPITRILEWIPMGRTIKQFMTNANLVPTATYTTRPLNNL